MENKVRIDCKWKLVFASKANDTIWLAMQSTVMTASIECKLIYLGQPRELRIERQREPIRIVMQMHPKKDKGELIQVVIVLSFVGSFICTLTTTTHIN